MRLGDNGLTFENLVKRRRAYRSLEPVKITQDLIEETARVAQLAPSCFNKQPWRYVFVYDKTTLTKLQTEGLSKGNQWAKAASMIIAVFSRVDMDCVIGDRQYYLFDSGMATAIMILHLTDQGLVAHPIAGFDPVKVKELLEIPNEMHLITLIIVGKKSNTIPDFFKDYQKKSEVTRPERKSLNEFIYLNKYIEK
ncbi:MAG: nitroreductase family protein [Candidatus Heimdallarchaeota archaeon]|nr:MAG: nitroreductase family protein [Candidatus Heimdallarchaeota archaeon]